VSLVLTPISFRDANTFVAKHHRHHQPDQGCKFCIGCENDGIVCGVVIVGRPKARKLDNGKTLELTRVCTDGTPHAASKLIAAATRAAFAMGAEQVVSYVLETEAGTSYRAAGWECAPGLYGGGSWDCASYQRSEPMAKLLGLAPKAPECSKRRWFKRAS